MKLRQLGPAVLGTILAACGGGSNDAPTPVNVAPVVSSIADRSITANQASAAIPFTVSDERPDNLVVSAMSDNTELVSESGLTLSGNKTSRNLVITPNADTTGDAFITLFATDSDGLTASTSFLLDVNAEQKSLQQFVRAAYAMSADEEPQLINAVEFDQDAGDDDFSDLLAQ